MKKAIGYLRVSSDKQAKEGHGLEVQEKAIKKFCEEQDIKLLEIFSDEGISGAEDIEKRDGLASCFNFLKNSKEKPHYVIVQKFDRFARDTILLGYLEFELKKCKCELLAVDQNFNKDPSGKLMKDIISAFAAFEKNMINLRTSSGKKNKIEKKLFTGGKIPLGYRLIESDYIKIDAETAPIVRRIFALRANDHSYREISKLILKEFDFKIHFTSVKYILNNKVYIGELSQEKEYSIHVPPLVSLKEFNEVHK